MKVGFIGLGNVGGKLAGSLLRNGHDVTVRDLDPLAAQAFLDKGAHWADSPRELAEAVDMVITCLPSPTACSLVMESEDGIIADLSEGKIWLEMSTTDDAELRRIAELVLATGPERWKRRYRVVVIAPRRATSPSSLEVIVNRSSRYCRY